ncbi:DUF4424 family protein [Candidatus Nucleicultrix amoebiphila]|jgi:hypothetical protein|uniref:DUF4424 family protein n=1 Tax=Candidatus Nucleicultrix amoebiphila TaxID=1509244 RepID=UPI000A268767|nr:DUF4424 family protein [Candidatus Nucleicultrix amoebiphila]
MGLSSSSRRFLYAAFTVIGLGVLSYPARANDTSATVAGGGIHFKKSADISMDKEVLKISVDKIDIRYVFFNHADKEVHELIAFPLPLSPYGNAEDNWRVHPSWDEDYMARKLLDENPGSALDQHPSNCNLKCWLDNAAFINFERTVNGEKYGYNYRTQAFDPNGKDITNLLIKHKIPLSSAYLIGYMEEGALHQNKALQEKLKKLHLLDGKGNPLWKTQTTYFWQQYFKPQSETVVTHSYKPQAGYHWLTGKDIKTFDDIKIESRDLDEKSWRNYCVRPDDQAQILSYFKALRPDDSQVVRAMEVQYILSTGANWNGPIKDFTLEITPPTPDTIVAFCWPGAVEKSEMGTVIARAENFTPDKDLKVLFISLKPGI